MKQWKWEEHRGGITDEDYTLTGRRKEFHSFREYGSMPETYACAVVAATIGECGICGWIRTNKDKRLDRKWQKEDEKESQEQYVPDINVGNKNEEENL